MDPNMGQFSSAQGSNKTPRQTDRQTTSTIQNGLKTATQTQKQNNSKSKRPRSNLQFFKKEKNK